MKTPYLFILIAAILLITGCASSNKSQSVAEPQGQSASVQDGTSFEKAIVVKNIDEEYDWIRKNYPESRFLGQALLFNNKKPFDRLSIELPSGEKKDVYFDISKFFGKF